MNAGFFVACAFACVCLHTTEAFLDFPFFPSFFGPTGMNQPRAGAGGQAGGNGLMRAYMGFQSCNPFSAPRPQPPMGVQPRQGSVAPGARGVPQGRMAGAAAGPRSAVAQPRQAAGPSPFDAFLWADMADPVDMSFGCFCRVNGEFFSAPQGNCPPMMQCECEGMGIFRK